MSSPALLRKNSMVRPVIFLPFLDRDVFDTGSPPSYARTLYNRFVVNLQQTGCHLVVLAGNHDSVATLNESRDIMAFLNTTVVASAGHAPQILPRRDGTPGAVLCLSLIHI